MCFKGAIPEINHIIPPVQSIVHMDIIFYSDSAHHNEATDPRIILHIMLLSYRIISKLKRTIVVKQREI